MRDDLLCDSLSANSALDSSSGAQIRYRTHRAQDHPSLTPMNRLWDLTMSFARLRTAAAASAENRSFEFASQFRMNRIMNGIHRVRSLFFGFGHRAARVLGLVARLPRVRIAGRLIPGRMAWIRLGLLAGFGLCLWSGWQMLTGTAPGFVADLPEYDQVDTLVESLGSAGEPEISGRTPQNSPDPTAIESMPSVLHAPDSSLAHTGNIFAFATRDADAGNQVRHAADRSESTEGNTFPRQVGPASQTGLALPAPQPVIPIALNGSVPGDSRSSTQAVWLTGTIEFLDDSSTVPFGNPPQRTAESDLLDPVRSPSEPRFR